MFFMKITNNPNIQKILGVYRKNTEAVQKTTKINQEKDKVEISDKAKDFQFALNAYKNLPEARKDKVEEINKKIQSGSYNPTGEEIVDSIFDRKI